jgi:hypothetical protein
MEDACLLHKSVSAISYMEDSRLLHTSVCDIYAVPILLQKARQPRCQNDSLDFSGFSKGFHLTADHRRFREMVLLASSASVRSSVSVATRFHKYLWPDTTQGHRAGSSLETLDIKLNNTPRWLKSNSRTDLFIYSTTYLYPATLIIKCPLSPCPHVTSFYLYRWSV